MRSLSFWCPRTPLPPGVPAGGPPWTAAGVRLRSARALSPRPLPRRRPVRPPAGPEGRTWPGGAGVPGRTRGDEGGEGAGGGADSDDPVRPSVRDARGRAGDRVRRTGALPSREVREENPVGSGGVEGRRR